MAFYVYNSFNEQGVYSGRKDIFFNNESEKVYFSKEFYEKYGEDPSFHQCNSLKEIIIDIKLDGDSHYWQIESKEIIEIYNDIMSQFGVDFVREKFPYEEMNDEFIRSIEAECAKFHQDLEDRYYENLLECNDCSEDDFHDLDIKNEEEFYENELKRWDEETDGSWRIANDLE